MRRSVVNLFIIALTITCFGGIAHAASITVSEPSDAPPTVATTGLGANVGVDTAPEFAAVRGVLSGDDAASLGAPDGFSRFAVLLEPPEDPFGPRISDIINLQVGPLSVGSAGPPTRTVTLLFFSDGFGGFDSILPPGTQPPAVLETGELQNITNLFDVNAQHLQIIVSSDLATPEVAEPTTVAVLGLGLAGLGWTTRRRRPSR